MVTAGCLVSGLIKKAMHCAVDISPPAAANDFVDIQEAKLCTRVCAADILDKHSTQGNTPCKIMHSIIQHSSSSIFQFWNIWQFHNIILVIINCVRVNVCVLDV